MWEYLNKTKYARCSRYLLTPVNFQPALALFRCHCISCFQCFFLLLTFRYFLRKATRFLVNLCLTNKSYSPRASDQNLTCSIVQYGFLPLLAYTGDSFGNFQQQSRFFTDNDLSNLALFVGNATLFLRGYYFVLLSFSVQRRNQTLKIEFEMCLITRRR